MSEIRTSVIVLAYGDEIHLTDCVAAVLNTTTEEVELIVVNNGADHAARRADHFAAARAMSPIQLGVRRRLQLRC